MEQVPPPSTQPAEESRWPAFPILFYGTFGSRTPAGRRYHRQFGIALFVLALGMLALTMFRAYIPEQILRPLMGVLPGGVFAYIAWSCYGYLRTLDELARRMQLEAMAWTYLTGIAAAALLGGFALAYNWGQWFLNPIWFLILEPVRGAWLYVVSRRY
jgi:hypothetical protein